MAQPTQSIFTAAKNKSGKGAGLERRLVIV